MLTIKELEEKLQQAKAEKAADKNNKELTAAQLKTLNNRIAALQKQIRRLTIAQQNPEKATSTRKKDAERQKDRRKRNKELEEAKIQEQANNYSNKKQKKEQEEAKIQVEERPVMCTMCKMMLTQSNEAEQTLFHNEHDRTETKISQFMHASSASSQVGYPRIDYCTSAIGQHGISSSQTNSSANSDRKPAAKRIPSSTSSIVEEDDELGEWAYFV